MSAQILHFVPMEDAPNRIRALRMARGWSQQRLADAINMSKMNISEIERGNVMLNLDHMRRIARVLGCNPGDLLKPSDNPYILSEDERELVDRLRAASADRRDELRRVADVMLPWKAGDRATGTDPVE